MVADALVLYLALHKLVPFLVRLAHVVHTSTSDRALFLFCPGALRVRMRSDGLLNERCLCQWLWWSYFLLLLLYIFCSTRLRGCLVQWLSTGWQWISIFLVAIHCLV
jgi:hypothetical protein